MDVRQRHDMSFREHQPPKAEPVSILGRISGRLTVRGPRIEPSGSGLPRSQQSWAASLSSYPPAMLGLPDILGEYFPFAKRSCLAAPCRCGIWFGDFNRARLALVVQKVPGSVMR
jgi:hypothetical protein